MAQHIACLSFDFDAMTGMVARGLKSPTAISRGEYGAAAVDRILRLLSEKGVKTTWFVPGIVVHTYPDHVRRVAGDGHEIGNHGWSHVPPTSLTPEQEDRGFARANEAIAKVAGQPPRGYRSPSWDLSPVTIDLLIKHGFVYDTSMMGHDHHPYFARRGDIVPDEEPMKFGETTRLVEMPISWSLDDFPHFEYLRMPTLLAPGLANADLVLENFLNDFRYMTKLEEWGILTYTLHPFVIGRGHRMLMLEKLIDGLAGLGATFVTMEQAVNAFLDRGKAAG